MKFIESPVLELKEKINADFKKEIIAFANTDGGEIFVELIRRITLWKRCARPC